MKHLLLLLLCLTSHAHAGPPQLQLANKYTPNINLKNYWVSEKYDGVRAYWNGTHLLSRQGNLIQAPSGFTDVLPDTPLDGELWLGRGQFDQVSGIVRQHKPLDKNWQKIKYMVFDLPNSPHVFNQRLIQLKSLIKHINAPHIQLVKQIKIHSHSALKTTLDNITHNQGEGLMLHLGTSLYTHTRSNDLLKLKKHRDAEATVVKHLPGKGKFKGLMGSMLVETHDNKRFKIGSGFSLSERQQPPAIGATITYQYFGLTSKGTPRFASFLRVYNAF